MHDIHPIRQLINLLESDGNASIAAIDTLAVFIRDLFATQTFEFSTRYRDRGIQFTSNFSSNFESHLDGDTKSWKSQSQTANIKVGKSATDVDENAIVKILIEELCNSIKQKVSTAVQQNVDLPATYKEEYFRHYPDINNAQLVYVFDEYPQFDNSDPLAKQDTRNVLGLLITINVKTAEAERKSNFQMEYDVNLTLQSGNDGNGDSNYFHPSVSYDIYGGDR